ncbi:MAG: HlyD family type I secretion periplasmic adaptor subunit [Telmatospirillum sp.]|nr:HlyD family type I secretion periplasmic adaptor subunit [Telmatospirillum sp.]
MRGEAWRDVLLMRFEPLRRHVAIWQAAWRLEGRKPRLAPRTSDELAFLPAALEIVETPASPLGHGTLWLVTGLFSSVLLWSVLGEVDIHATAQGRVIPAGKTKPVAALEAASVAAIYVKDGDHVDQGAVLIALDPAGPQADTARLTRECLELVVTTARLRALLEGREDFTLPDNIGETPALVGTHRQQLRQQLASHRAIIESLELERRQKEAEQLGTGADIQRLEQTVPLLAEQAFAKREMAARGWQSRTEYLRIEQERIDRKQALEVARHKFVENEAAIANVRERLREEEAKFRGGALAQLAEAEQKVASLEQDLVKAEDRRRLYQLKAPSAGVIQQLTVHAAGAVVTQGLPLLMVVPDDGGIAIEAALENKDAGFVHPGQTAEIKVESFPFTRYGTIAGVVQTISRDTVQGPDSDLVQRRQVAPAGIRDIGQPTVSQTSPVYVVRVTPLATAMQVDGHDMPLSPGMAVTAEIKTGRRRIIDYVLDPVLRYRDESMRER